MSSHTSRIAARLPLEEAAASTGSLLGAFFVAAMSLAVQGFAYGIGNNIFHIPFVLEWNRLPQFADDAFYQTLDGFTSGLWWLVRWFATEESLPAVFLTLHIAGRILGVIALEHALRTVAPSFKERMLALLVATLSLTSMPSSPLGVHDLFVGYLTHSAFLWPFFVGAFTCAIRDCWRLAALFASLTFVLNAFVGVWCAAALAGLAFFGERKPSFATQVHAALVFLCTAAPVVIWIVEAADGLTGGQAFSFREYIRTFYAAHFLIEVAHWPAILNVAALILSVLFFVSRLGWREWSVILTSLSCLLIVGVLAPYLIDSRVVFNLHLLRVDGAIIFLGTPLLVVVALRLLLRPESGDERVLGCLLLMSCVTGQYAVGALAWGMLAVIRDRQITTSIGLLALLALIASYAIAADWVAANRTVAAGLAFAAGAMAFAGNRPVRYETIYAMIAAAAFLALLVIGMRSGLMGSGAAARALAAVAFLAVMKHRTELTAFVPVRLVQVMASASVACAALIACLVLLQLASIWSEAPGRKSLTNRDRDWVDLVSWVREERVAGPVLIPVKRSDHMVDYNFQLYSRVPVWVDWKQGAAVMWDPSFHAVWRPRFEAVRQLQHATEYAAYAQENGIPLFVAEQRQCPDSSEMLYSNNHFALCKPAQNAPS